MSANRLVALAALSALMLTSSARVAAADDAARFIVPMVPFVIDQLLRGQQPPPNRQVQPRGQRREPRPAAAAAEPRMSQKTRLRVQVALAELGRYGGPIDGKIGRGTRVAIAQWQASINAPANGWLTTDQLGLLLEIAPESAVADIGGDAFAPGGEGGPVEGFGDAEADGSGAGGVVEGGDVLGGDVEVVEGGMVEGGDALSGELDKEAIAELQGRLNELGYDVGTADGVIGQRTRTAILDFQQAEGIPSSGEADGETLRALRSRTGGGERGTASDLGSYARLDLAGGSGGEAAAAVQRELALRAFAAEPDLLDDPAVIQRFFSAEDARTGGDDARKLREANEFDRPKILEALAARLRAEAAEAGPWTKPIRISASFTAALGSYSPEEGFPVQTYGMSPGDRGAVLDIRNDYLAGRPFAVLGDLPELDHISVPPATAERLIAELGPDGRNRLIGVVWISLSGFGEISAEPNDVRVPVVASVDAVTLHRVERDERNREQTGAQIYRWPSGKAEEAVPESSTGTDPLALARVLGIPVLDGALVSLSSRMQQVVFGDRARAMAAYQKGWMTLFDYVAVATRPEIVENENAMLQLAQNYWKVRGSRFEQNRYDLTSQFKDEFEKVAYIERAAEELLPVLRRRAPTFPLRVTDIREVQLGQYDFKNGAFPLQYNTSLVPGFQHSGITNLGFGLPLPGLPTELRMSREEAQALSRSLKKPRYGNPEIYLAITTEVRGVDPETEAQRSNGMIDVNVANKVVRVALFRDHRLKDLITEFPIGTAAPGEGPVNDVDFLNAIQISPTAAVLNRVLIMTGDTAAADALVKATQEYRNANEFERDRVHDELSRELLSQWTDETFWLAGTIAFSEYTEGGYPVTGIGLETMDIQNGRPTYRNHLAIEIADSPLLKKIMIEPSEAERALNENNGQRQFQIRARVRPIHASLDRTVDPLVGRLTVAVDEAVIFYRDRQRGDVWHILVHLKRDPAAETPPDEAPPAAATPEADPAPVEGEEPTEVVLETPPATDPVAAPPAEEPAQGPKLDIIGITLGMDMAEAEAILRDHMQVDRIFEARRTDVGDPAQVAVMNSAKAFVRADGQEVIILFDEPPAARGKVVAIARTVYFADRSLPPELAMDNLRGKYGKENLLQVNASAGTILAGWMPGSGQDGGRLVQQCYAGRNRHVRDPAFLWSEADNPQQRPWDTAKDGTTGALALFQQAPPLLPTVPSVLESPGPVVGQCGPVLYMEHSRSAVDILGTVLFDPAVYDALHAESIRKVEAGERIYEPREDGSKPALKL